MKRTKRKRLTAVSVRVNTRTMKLFIKKEEEEDESAYEDSEVSAHESDLSEEGLDWEEMKKKTEKG